MDRKTLIKLYEAAARAGAKAYRIGRVYGADSEEYERAINAKAEADQAVDYAQAELGEKLLAMGGWVKYNPFED